MSTSRGNIVQNCRKCGKEIWVREYRSYQKCDNCNNDGSV